MCPDPLEEVLYFFFYPRFAWKTWSVIIGIVSLMYLLTGHPTISDVGNEINHGINYLHRSDFGIPNYIIYSIMIIVSAVIVVIAILREIKQQKEWDATTWQRWNRLMFEHRGFFHEAEAYYYGEVSN